MFLAKEFEKVSDPIQESPPRNRKAAAAHRQKIPHRKDLEQIHQLEKNQFLQKLQLDPEDHKFRQRLKNQKLKKNM